MSPPVAEAPATDAPAAVAPEPVPEFPDLVREYAAAVRDELDAGERMAKDEGVVAALRAFEEASAALKAKSQAYAKAREEAHARQTAAKAAMLKHWPGAEAKTIKVAGHEVTRRTQVRIIVRDTPRALAEFHRLGNLGTVVDDVSFNQKALQAAHAAGLLRDVTVIPAGATGPDAHPAPLLDRVEAHSIAVKLKEAA